MDQKTRREALPTVDMTRPTTRKQGEAFALEFERRAEECDRLRKGAKTERLRANCAHHATTYRSSAARLRSLLPTLPE